MFQQLFQLYSQHRVGEICDMRNAGDVISSAGTVPSHILAWHGKARVFSTGDRQFQGGELISLEDRLFYLGPTGEWKGLLAKRHAKERICILMAHQNTPCTCHNI